MDVEHRRDDAGVAELALHLATPAPARPRSGAASPHPADPELGDRSDAVVDEPLAVVGVDPCAGDDPASPVAERYCALPSHRGCQQR
jgi:hypothetical protein